MAEEHPRDTAARYLRENGYAKGGDVHTDEKQDRELIREMVKPAALQARKHGGAVHGEKSEARPDRRARGGAAPKKAAVNIKIGGADNGAQAQEQAAQALQVGRQQGAQMAAAKLAQAQPRPPMPPPGAGAAPPPGARPMPPPGAGGPPMAKRGGTIKRASGGDIPPKALSKPEKGEEYEPESPDHDRDDRRRGGMIKVRAHERRAGGAL